MNDKKNLTKDELANYLKNLKNKAPPKRSSLITPPKSPITSTVPSNNNNNINNVILSPSSPPSTFSSSSSSSSSIIVDSIPTYSTERKVGGLYGPRVYPSPNKTTSILTRSLSQKIEENIKTPSSPESVSSSAAYSPPSSTQLNTTDSALSESSFRETITNKIDKNNDINELINDLTYPTETKLSFKQNNNQTTDVNSSYNNNNNIDEGAISANASNTKIDDGTKGSYVLSAAFKSHTASSKPASRTPSLIKQTPEQIQSEINKNKKIYNSTVNILQKQHQFDKQLNNELKNNNNGNNDRSGGNNESYWNAQFDDAQKKFPHSEKSDEKNISNSNNTINNNNGIAINNNSIGGGNNNNNNNNNNNSNRNSINSNISENNQEHKRNSTPTSKIHPSNNQPLGDNNNNSRLSSSIHNIASLNCGGCGKSITGKVLSAMGKKWHPDHFTCTKCNTSLEHVAFFEQDGLPYCHLDFHELFSPRCGYCNTPIEGQSITALGKSWHVGHFFCRECGGPFESGGFMVHDGFPYCEKDWMKKFAPKCKGCQNPIKGEFTNALDGKWHRDCFGCKTCKQPFNSSYYYIHQGQPYCDVHYREMLNR